MQMKPGNPPRNPPFRWNSTLLSCFPQWGGRTNSPVLKKTKTKLCLCSAEPSHISEVWLYKWAARKRHISKETHQLCQQKNKTSKQKTTKIQVQKILTCWETEPTSWNSPFLSTPAWWEVWKTTQKTSKKKKVPRFPVTIVVFVPFDSNKCNFGTRHKPRSVTEEENVTRTLPDLLSKRKKTRGKEKTRKGKKRREEKGQKEKKGNLVWERAVQLWPETPGLQDEALTNQRRGGSRARSGDVSSLKAALAFLSWASYYLKALVSRRQRYLCTGKAWWEVAGVPDWRWWKQAPLNLWCHSWCNQRKQKTDKRWEDQSERIMGLTEGSSQS